MFCIKKAADSIHRFKNFQNGILSFQPLQFQARLLHAIQSIFLCMCVSGIVEAFMHMSDYSSKCNAGQEMFYCAPNQTWPGHSGPRYQL